jgi:heterodisulfide reductase subunit A-like polyferredoxin
MADAAGRIILAKELRPAVICEEYIPRRGSLWIDVTSKSVVNMVSKALVSLLAIIAGVTALSDETLLNATYDYVIVGGGTSGLTVANRLTENGKREYILAML